MKNPYRTAAGVTVVILGVLAGAWILILLKSLVVLLAIAGLLAAALDRPVTNLQRRLHLKRRGASVALVGLIALGAIGGLGFLIARPVAQQAATFKDRLPAAAERLKELPLVGPRLADNDLRGSTERLIHDLPQRLRGKSQVLLGVAQTAATSLALLGTTLVAVIFLLLNGPSLASGASGLIMDHHRRSRAQRLGGEILSAVGGYVRGNLLISLVASVVVVVTLEAMRVPFVGVLAVVMFVLDLVPLVGASAAGVLITLATFLLDPHPWKALVFAVVFVVYQEVESHTLYPIIMGRTVKIPAIAVFFATLAGAELAGILGALLAIPVAATTNIVMVDILEQRRRGAAQGELEPVAADG